jgi:hypothetical protein
MGEGKEIPHLLEILILALFSLSFESRRENSDTRQTNTKSCSTTFPTYSE